MTIQDVINKVQTLRAPAPDETELLEAINEVEGEIMRKIIAPRDPNITSEPYTQANMQTVLKAPSPFDDVYIKGCLRYIDGKENQITNENNSDRAYEEVFGELAAWWLRTHRPERRRMHSRWYGV